MLSLWQNRSRAHIQNLEVYLFIAIRNLTHKSIKSQINLRKYREYQLLTRVTDTKLLDGTYVIILGDNGWLMTEHGLTSKVLAYEESMRILFSCWGRILW